MRTLLTSRLLPSLLLLAGISCGGPSEPAEPEEKNDLGGTLTVGRTTTLRLDSASRPGQARAWFNTPDISSVDAGTVLLNGDTLIKVIARYKPGTGTHGFGYLLDEEGGSTTVLPGVARQTFAIGGSADVKPFTTSITTPDDVEIVEPTVATPVTRSQGFTVRWQPSTSGLPTTVRITITPSYEVSGNGQTVTVVDPRTLASDLPDNGRFDVTPAMIPAIPSDAKLYVIVRRSNVERQAINGLVYEVTGFAETTLEGSMVP